MLRFALVDRTYVRYNGNMLGEVGKVRAALEALARDFDASALHGRASLEMARDLGVIQSLLDGLKARVCEADR